MTEKAKSCEIDQEGSIAGDIALYSALLRDYWNLPFTVRLGSRNTLQM